MSIGRTRKQALSELSLALAQANIEEAAREAELIALWVLQIDRLALYCDSSAPISLTEEGKLETALARRLKDEPVSRIIGRRGFWTLDIEVRPHVLDPRADSESVIEAATRRFAALGTSPRRILDLGCGSGALLCALLAEFPQSFGVGVDRSPAAIAATYANLCSNGFDDRATLMVGSWLEPVHPDLTEAHFDLIVSNPPYIATHEIEGLEASVRDYDPILALDGGPDGLDAYRAILPEAARRIRPAGCLIVEIGAQQFLPVKEIAQYCGLELLLIQNDLGGHKRALCFSLKGSTR